MTEIESRFVAVDWGTTQLRAYLCVAGAGVAGRIVGPGIARLTDTPSATLLRMIADWTAKFGFLDLLLGGMAGSNIGWRAAPYLPCPIAPADIAGHLLTFNEQGHRVAIVPGLSCANTLGQPDVMRGEEIQVLGWMARYPEREQQLLCLPGTHTKWVRIRAGRIETFTTSLTGELFALLRDHSILAAVGDRAGSIDDNVAFLDGVQTAARHGPEILHLLFSTRSRALLQPDTASVSMSYLSGLLIGSDVTAALSYFDVPDHTIELVGTAELCERFAVAIQSLGVAARTFDGDEMVVAGFRRIAELAQ